MAAARAAAPAAALVVLAVAAGSAAFAVVREDPPPPTTTTTTTTTIPVDQQLAAAIVTTLQRDLAVPLTDIEARCVAEGLVAQVSLPRLEELSGNVAALTEAERSGFVRTVVGCVTEEKAAALLQSAPSTTIVVQLPDEGL